MIVIKLRDYTILYDFQIGKIDTKDTVLISSDVILNTLKLFELANIKTIVLDGYNSNIVDFCSNIVDFC